MHLLDTLCAPPAPHPPRPGALSLPGTPRSGATGNGFGSPQSTPASARAAAPASVVGGAGEAEEAGGQQASLPESRVEVERLLQDTSGDRKDMRALKESILRNLRRT